MNHRRTAPAVLLAASLVLAACGGDDDAAPATTGGPATTEAPDSGNTPESTDATPATDPPAATDAPTGPATIAAQDQSGDGGSVVVESVALPTDGFVVIHADADGAPGPILGWSDLLPAGESSDVTVELNEPIAETAVVHPMAHVDANGNGEYEFMPPDVTIDIPATTDGGDIAMLPVTYTVAAAGDPDDLYGDTGGTDGGEDAEAAGLQLAATPLGEVLADSDGWILYLFTPDEQSESTCYDGCEANWPVVTEVTSVGEGLDSGLLGTTMRKDGTVQATYNGWPLYYFAGDPSPGTTNGQGLNDIWWTIDADGNAVGM